MEKELEKFSQEKRAMDKKVMQLQKEQNQLSLQSSARGVLEELRKQRRATEERYQLK